MNKQLIGVGFVVIVAFLIFYGYVHFQKSDISEKVFEHSLPKAKIEAGGKKIDMAQGTYCWSYMTMNRCADMIGPIDLVKFHKIKPTAVKPNEKISIHYDQKPKKVSVGAEIWTGNNPSNVKFINNQIVAPTTKGIYVYSLHGNWKKGSASQVFTIEVK